MTTARSTISSTERPCPTTWKDWCGGWRTGTTPSSSEVLVSTPGFRADVNCRDLLRALRFELDLYVNLRPAPLLHPDFCPLKKDAPIDLVVVRENTEGLNVRVGGNFKKGTPDEVAIQGGHQHL